MGGVENRVAEAFLEMGYINDAVAAFWGRPSYCLSAEEEAARKTPGSHVATICLAHFTLSLQDFSLPSEIRFLALF